VMFFCEADGVVEPVEIEVAFGGFEARPGELTNTGDGKVRLLHQGKIGIPSGLRPLLWIPGSAKLNSLPIWCR